MKSKEEQLADYVRMAALLPEARAELMRFPGVTEVGVGVKEKNNRLTGETVFRVYVVEKRPAAALAPDAMIPTTVLGVPTDVVVQGIPEETDDDDKYRPLQGGIQIGNDTTTEVGTLGCIAQLNTDGSVVILGNQHVMLSGNAGNGEMIGQPTISCCCCCKGNIVADVVDSAYDGLVDCAIARVRGETGFTNEVQDIGPIFGSASPNLAGTTVTPNQAVRKRGRTTGLTTGTVSNPSIATPANPAKNVPARTNQIEITPDAGVEWFQFDGDSGAVLVDEENLVVGLMWGVDKGTRRAYANRITDVTSAMKITIPNSGTAGTVALGGMPIVSDAPPFEIDDASLRAVAGKLRRSAKGRSILELIERHRREIDGLLKNNREVTVAWHRFQGPAFTAHVIESARDRQHVIPPTIEGVAPANLVIRMSIVFQDHGSAQLRTDAEANTLPLLELLATGGGVHDLLDRFADDAATATERASSR